MSNRDGILRLTISSLLCVLIISYTFLSVVFANGERTISTISDTKDTATDFINIPANGYIGLADAVKVEQETSSEKAKEKNETQAESQPAASEGKVMGKIIEKFVTPYTANTSYDKVYLKNSTGLSVDIKELLGSPLGFKIEKNTEPQVLIMHTHTTESFMLEDRDYYTESDLSRRTDESYNNVKLGKIVTDKLNAAGIVTLHDTTTHDYPEYSGSYSRAATTIKSYLKKYPSIKIVIDMHRDAIASGESDKVKLITEIEGKKAAQIMLVMGSESGSVTDFPNWKENLKLGVRLQQKLEVMYPSLARSIHFCSRKYNENLTTGSMIIEMGTDANTIDEVSYSAELLANALTELLNGLG